MGGHRARAWGTRAAHAGRLCPTSRHTRTRNHGQRYDPREIQARIRSGASVADVAAESGMDPERIEAFAGPVLAEREHIAGAAQATTIRRRGEAGSHRRLGDLIATRLRSRGIDSDRVVWDAWRQSDLKWRVVAKLGRTPRPARPSSCSTRRPGSPSPTTPMHGG
ncbi:DUF3071 domain-containing protein [Tessaracoccus sp. HDW20]|nr:DUF3071 domain-containing protein [Tessaracoccus coleopterorum]